MTLYANDLIVRDGKMLIFVAPGSEVDCGVPPCSFWQPATLTFPGCWMTPKMLDEETLLPNSVKVSMVPVVNPL